MSLTYYAATAAAVVWFVLCLWHADDAGDYAFLGAGFTWGFILEEFSITGLGGYEYAMEGFAVTAGHVPLMIMFTWAAILYTGWQTGRYLGFGPRRLPFFVTLYAVHLDLALDVVAVRIPYWIWEYDVGLWFDVPINNYVGWYTVTLVFVGSYVALGRWIDDDIARAGLTLPSSALLFLVAMLIYGPITGSSQVAQTTSLVLFLAIALAVVLTGDVRPRVAPLSLAAVTVTIHLFFMGLGAATGMYGAEPELLVVGLVFLAVGLGVHAWPYWQRGREPAVAET